MLMICAAVLTVLDYDRQTDRRTEWSSHTPHLRAICRARGKKRQNTSRRR